MKRLTREDFLAATPRHEDVEVEEFGGIVTIWERSAAQRVEFERAIAAAPENEGSIVDVWALVVSRCLGDERGPWEPELTPDEVKAKGTSAVKYLYEVACRVNVVGRKAVEALRKNSPSETISSSPIVSPPITGS